LSAPEILGYIYAILHAPTYRDLYDELLRVNFPRVPFAIEAEDFEKPSCLGWALVEAHLLRNLKRGNLAAYHGKGDHVVDFVLYSEAEQSIAINATQKLAPVPKPVWDFHIGGYQVIHKYLKSRKGRKLLLGEIDHVAKVADALAFTIGQMAKIDDAYRAAFP
jgi:predicted helicase